MQPANLSRLGNDAARRLLGTEGYYMRHYGPTANKSKSTTAYGLLAKRFPQDYAAAREYLQSATDYSPPEVGKEAALNLLKFDPTDGNADTWRRLFVAADTAKDTAMVQQVYAWVMKSQQKFGKNSANASQIADILTKHKMEPQAVGYWNTYLTFDRNSTEARDCATRLLARIEPQPQRIAFMADLFKHDSDFHGRYASWLAHEYFEAKDLNNFVKVLQETRRRQNDRPFRGWDFDSVAAAGWVSAIRSNQEATVADRKRVYDVCEHLQLPAASAAAVLARLEITPADQLLGTARLLEYQRSTRIASNSYVGWDALVGYLQAAQTRKDFVAAATLATGMLNNIAGVDETRRKSARNIVTQSYSRIGRVGLTIDENSPVAPLLQAALYLRLGDENLAHDTFLENKPLFDQHRNELPVDLIAFICERSMAAGGDENHDYVEEVLRGWLVKNSEAPQVESSAKARVQLLLGRNYFKARRFDLARNEFTSTVNRYADTPQAIEAEFGIGESFMAQKVFDQAEQVFDKLARSRDTDVIVRAEFLRGVLAFRRGDRDEARDIFRGVLERVPNVKLANQALFNLAEVYGAEERYVDQLNLLRTVGRLGRRSKRLHTPGMPLSIVVHDSDLGISRGHNKIPVVVTTKPGGDTERMFLTSAGAGKGLFRVDVDTQLGQALPGDKILQLTGNDVIQCDYPDEFKAEFKNVPLSDVDIRVAASAEFEVSSSKIIDQEEETFSQQLVREAEREKQDQRVSQGRPANQIKPGNIIYLQVEDSDRDLSNDADRVIIKLTANSGDQVQVALQETGPHTGVFDGTAQTGELPAGALASDAAIGHSPLMAIDSDLESYWMSEPDGATPKHLTVDMKDLRLVSRVKLSSPGGGTGAPVRGNLFGSQDGQFWFRIASQPARPPAPRVVGDAKHMTRRIYPGGYTNYTNWDQVVALTKDVTPAGEEEVNELSWKSQPDEDGKFPAFAVVWHGTLVQPRSGAARIRVQGAVTGLAVDGKLEMPVGKGTQSVDLWLDRGPHELTIFSASSGPQAAEATLARASLTSQSVFLAPFRAADFDLNEISTQVAQQQGRQPTEISALDDVWEFRFRSHEVRYVRLVVNEYRGEAVAINHVEIGGEQDGLLYIPTEEDVLSLSTNELLEIAAGDVVTATYTDEITQNKSGGSQLLTRSLTATYNNASVKPIAYNFVRGGGGAVGTERKDLKRVDPGERVTVEIIDFDQDQTNDRDTIRFQLIVNDGEAVMLTATETEPYSGVFTKEVDTTA
ncbi:MAG: tetratricopeptide repeat protein, partial [Planctomycetota bacterium]|nr:tetratricopeptide repeat protein [Planctomycetota bacterium]